MMQGRLLLMVGIFFVNLIYGADDPVIKGIVRDGELGHPLAGASLKALNGEAGILTDAQGLFSLNTAEYPPGARFIVSYAGYTSDTVELSPGRGFYTLMLQPAPGLLKEVVVTGTGSRTLVKETPFALTLVPSRKIEQTLQGNIIDVLVQHVPGLSAVSTGPNVSKPFIRGLGYNRVLTLYDAVRQEGQQWGDEHGIEMDPYGIETAAVIKGPASLQYGSDALAGVVSMQPFVPNDQDGIIHGRLTSEYHQNNGLIGNGLRLYSSTPNWYWLAAGSYRIAKNYNNAVDGRVYNTGFKEGSAALSLGHRWSKGNSSLNFTLFRNLQGIPDGSRDSMTREFTKQLYEGAQDDIKDRPVVSSTELNSYELSPLHQYIGHYRIYSNNRYQLGKGTMEASVAWQQNIRKEYSHPTDPDQAGMYVRLNTLNYGLKYIWPILQNMELSVGSNGMYQENKNKDATNFPIPDYHLTDLGAFVFGRWKFDRWTVSGGFRYDHRQVNGASFYTVPDSLTGFDRRADSKDAGASLQFPAFAKDYRGVSLSAGVTYALNDHIALKVNLARGSRAPSITELASNGLDPGAHIIYIGNLDAVPEFSVQQDLGLELDYKDISGSISVFNNHISHYLYLTELAGEGGDGAPLLDPQGNKTFQYRQAAAHLYGLEFTANVHPVGWKGFCWNNSLALTYGVNTSPAFSNKGVAGRYLPYIPPASWLSTVTQAIALKNTKFTSVNLMAEMDYHAAQNRYLGLYNTETATPSYTLVNIAAGTSIQYSKTRHLELRFQINNMGNTVYQSSMSRLKYFEYYSASPNGRYGIYGIGRNLCVKLIVPI